MGFPTKLFSLTLLMAEWSQMSLRPVQVLKSTSLMERLAAALMPSQVVKSTSVVERSACSSMLSVALSISMKE